MGRGLDPDSRWAGFSEGKGLRLRLLPHDLDFHSPQDWGGIRPLRPLVVGIVFTALELKEAEFRLLKRALVRVLAKVAARPG